MSGTFSANAAANNFANNFFNATFYLQNSPDVVAAIARGQFQSAQQHYLQFGRFENRSPNASFNAAQYLINNPDVAAVVGSRGQQSAWDHFINFGVVEGRSSGVFPGTFNAVAYLAANPDVQAAVSAGVFRSAYEHFILFGAAEGRAATNTAGQSITTQPGQTFTLSLNEDNLVGTKANDTFNAPLLQSNAGVQAQTLQPGDKIDGLAGTDTLNATLDTNVTPGLTSVEVVNARFVGGSTLDLSSSSGVQTVAVASSTAVGTVTGVAGANLAVRDQKVGASFEGSTATALNFAATNVSKADGGPTPVVNLGTVAATTLNLSASGSSMALNSNSATAAKVLNLSATSSTVALDLGVTAAAAALTTLNLTTSGSSIKIDSTKADVLTTATVAATGTNTLTLTDSAATLTSLTVTGTGSLDVSGVALAAVKTLTVGDGGVKFDNTGAAANLLTATTGAGVDTLTLSGQSVKSVATGAGNDVVTLVGSALGATATVDLGAGDDRLTLGLTPVAGATVNGGEGNDTLNLLDGAALVAKAYTGFEVLDAGGGKGTYDLSLASFSAVQITAPGAAATQAAVTFTNAAAGFTLTDSGAKSTDTTFAGVTFGLKDASGTSDVSTVNTVITDGNNDGTAQGSVTYTLLKTSNAIETLNLNNSVATADTGVAASKYSVTFTELNVAGTTTLNLNSGASTSIGAGALKAGDLTSLAISGAGNVTITDVANATGLKVVDASASTGAVQIDLSASTAAAGQSKYVGSAGVDTVTAATNGTFFYTGSGADLVTLTAGKQDLLAYKAGTDSQLSDVSKDGKITIGADVASIDSVTNFQGGAAATSDRFDVTTFAFTGTQRGVVDVTAKVNANTDLTSVSGLFSDVPGNRGIAQATVGGDQYVFIDVNRDGSFAAGTDAVVKLVGAAGSTVDNFLF